MTTTIEMAAWLERQSKMATEEKCPKAAAQLDAIAQRLRELQAELDCYCPRPANGQTDHTSAGCIKRGECGCDIRCRVKEST